MSQLISRVGSVGAQIVSRRAASAFSTSSVCGRGSVSKGEVHPGYIKIREQYKRFQVDDGVPVHLKAGNRDKILYGLTILVTGIGLIECVRYYYIAAFPPKIA